jgi:uncharacterized protein (DUF2252 family)
MAADPTIAQTPARVPTLAAPQVVPTLADRAAAGRQCRETVPRASHGNWAPPPDRPDPVPALLAANAGRVAELLPVKWDRMAASPFAFFRGAAPLMAADLSHLPTTGLRVQICGDAHVRNLGAYAAPDGHLVFDLNDFDETIVGPWEWDLKRLAVSFVLANRDAGGRDKDGLAAVHQLAESYRESLGRFAGMRALELVSYEVRRHSKSGPVRAVLQKAERATPARALQKLTAPAPDGTLRFHDQPPLLKHVSDEDAAKVVAALQPYRDTLGADHRQVLDAYRPVDVAFKVVGTGSIGTRDYVVLLFGRGPDDPLFLQVKEELPSCWTPHLPEAPSYLNQGQRVAEGQHRLQTVTDAFVGWTAIDGAGYLVRQLADHKAAVDPAELKGDALTEYALVCGEVLAKAHARTGDAAALAAYCGRGERLDLAIGTFAFAYAEQTVQDHAAFVEAVKDGRLKTEPGV